MFKKAKTNKKPATNKRRRGVAWWLGFTDLADGFKAVWGGIAESGHRTVRLAQAYRKWFESAKRKGRVETFEQAVERMKLTPEFLARRQKQLFVEGLAFTVGLSITLYFAFVNVLRGDWISFLPCLCLSLFVGALAFQAFFRHWQIVERRLDSPRDFVRATLGIL